MVGGREGTAEAEHLALPARVQRRENHRPGNRDPQREEIESCVPYLEKQIDIIKPEIICTLGNYSTAYILERYGLKDKIQGISKIHGQIFEVSSLFQDLKIIPLYHPAVATYNPNMKEVLRKDFKILAKFK